MIFSVSDDLFFVSSSLIFHNEQLLHLITMKSTFIFSQASDYFLLNGWSLSFWSFSPLVSLKEIGQNITICLYPQALTFVHTTPHRGTEPTKKQFLKQWQQSCLRNNSPSLTPDTSWLTSRCLLSRDPTAPLQGVPRQWGFSHHCPELPGLLRCPRISAKDMLILLMATAQPFILPQTQGHREETENTTQKLEH